MEQSLKTKITVALAFSIAMAFLESAVVVYLRFLLYPDGFALPLKEMGDTLIITELGREAATVIMLVSGGYMLATNKLSRFAWFLFCFAVWDIFYYVFLYVILQWPDSILHWDILFLIPVAWYGPVLTPVLVSLSMITFALIIVKYEHKGAVRRIRKREWGTMLIGCSVILYTFMYPFFNYAAGQGKHWSLPNSKELVKASLHFIPESYDWFLYGIGLLIIWIGIIVYWRRIHNTNAVMY
jgi:hypothetical protein